MHYSFSFACPIELLNIYQQTCIILLRMNSNVESFHNVIQSSVKNTHSRMWKTDTSLKKDIMKRLVKSLFFCCFMFYGQIAFWPDELCRENACGKDAYGETS